MGQEISAFHVRILGQLEKDAAQFESFKSIVKTFENIEAFVGRVLKNAVILTFSKLKTDLIGMNILLMTRKMRKRQ
jgi:hypothetical protein